MIEHLYILVVQETQRDCALLPGKNYEITSETVDKIVGSELNLNHPYDLTILDENGFNAHYKFHFNYRLGEIIGGEVNAEGCQKARVQLRKIDAQYREILFVPIGVSGPVELTEYASYPVKEGNKIYPNGGILYEDMELEFIELSSFGVEVYRGRKVLVNYAKILEEDSFYVFGQVYYGYK